ncbi:hypothetical protein EBU71_02395 [bacterium]|nr:hypothetical protein [Candidatus Elulimicrobium humile]
MSNPSNLYAEKIYAEHPEFLWALDDKADYVSIISEINRDTSTWSIENGSSTETENFLDAPFPDSIINKIVPTSVLSETFSTTLVSPEIVNVNDLNQILKTFSIGSYFYTSSPYALSVEIGYRYYDDALETFVDVLKNYDASLQNKWYFISETFSPEFNNSAIRLVIKINYLGTSVDIEDYLFYINGITFGQWAEEFQSSSLGVYPISLPSNIALDAAYVVEASAYGLSDYSGYYFVNNKSLVAKNFGVPMVFGSQNITKLYENDNNPSLIIPSNGMLSDGGRYREFTLEFWIRTNNSSTTSKRIVGPISSTDGIYLDGPFLMLKINNQYASYYVGQWERPMLIDWKYSNNLSTILLNGEEIISLSLNSETLTLPDKTNELGKNQDWIGFYAYTDIQPIELDCVAIYPYLVPSLVAKRRFVYGQGVQYPENLNASYGGSTVLFDYSFADYTKNYNYPDLGSWGQASIDNVLVEDNYLTSINFEKPKIIINDTAKTESDLLTDCAVIQNEDSLFLDLRPTEEWNSINSYVYFNNFSLNGELAHAFYGIFKKPSNFSGTQVLIRLEDQYLNYFSIECVNNDVRYILKYGESIPQVIYEALEVQNETMFTVGLEIDVFRDYFGGDITSFFTNSNLSMYVGGTRNFENTFTGNIYKIAICSEKNVKDISNLFNIIGVPKDYENIFNLYAPGVEYDGGDADQDFWNYYLGSDPEEFSPSSFINIKLSEHTPSCGITPKNYFDNFYIDIDTKGSWRDYVPLSYFGQYITDEYGDSKFGLDFIQFNVNYPAPAKFKETEIVDEDGWKYSELSEQYSYPVQRTYESLDNYLYTGYVDYQDLAEKATKIYSYDTSESILKTYITFEYLETGANASNGFFVNTEDVPKNGVITPDENWINTKYEVVDNVIIYPPKNVDFNKIAIVVHLEFEINGVLYRPIKIKNLQLSSQAFNYNTANNIGTRFGTNVYPYISNGYYYNYKAKNPFSIYKGSSPYLYLTRYSGLEIKGDYDPLNNRGVAIPINSNKTENYEVMAMQSLIRFNGDFFPYAPTQIMQINAKNKIIKFYMVANHPTGKRAKIYAIDGNTGALYDGIVFYVNGQVVKEPILNINEWIMLGIGFPSILNFKSYAGSVMINGPIIFNSLSYYQTTNLQAIQTVTKRPWARVKFSIDGLFDWEYWNDYYLWQGVLVQSSVSYYGVNPSDLYKAYTGTNKIIIDDDRVFSINGYEYSVLKDILWQSQISDAV